MEKNNNKKRWIAVGLALAIFLLSLLTSGIEAKNNANNKLKEQAYNRLGLMEENIIQGKNPNQQIMVLNVDGVIQSDDTNDFIVEKLNDAAKDPNVVGIIMHVNSPGGSVYASERVANAIKKVKSTEKPVYSVMQEMAASGGYYISAPCDKIYASNETWTGSIGVIIQNYNLAGLFDKYGIKEQNITTGKMKDAGSPGHEMSKEEKAYFQGLVDSAFERFVAEVSEGRDMSETSVKSLADGRVYDGSQALENGLVDKIGDLELAVADMTEEYNLSDPMVVEKDNMMASFSKYFPGFKSLVDSPKSDLQALQELMEANDNLPMYLYGGYNE